MRLKMVYMRLSAKKHFSKSKSHSLNAAHDQKTSLAQKKISSAILLSLTSKVILLTLGQNAA